MLAVALQEEADFGCGMSADCVIWGPGHPCRTQGYFGEMHLGKRSNFKRNGQAQDDLGLLGSGNTLLISSSERNL